MSLTYEFSTTCLAKNPEKCKDHGGRMVDGVHSPRPWHHSDDDACFSLDADAPGVLRDSRIHQGQQPSMPLEIYMLPPEVKVSNDYNLDVVKKSRSRKWEAYTKGPEKTPVAIRHSLTAHDVEVGDFFLYGMVESDFFLHQSFYYHSKNRPVFEYLVHLPKDFWESQFPALYHQEIIAFLEDITNDPSDDEKWKHWSHDIKERWRSTGSIIRLAPKRDHRKVKRMDCVIPYPLFIDLVRKFGVNDFSVTR